MKKCRNCRVSGDKTIFKRFRHEVARKSHREIERLCRSLRSDAVPSPCLWATLRAFAEPNTIAHVLDTTTTVFTHWDRNSEKLGQNKIEGSIGFYYVAYHASLFKKLDITGWGGAVGVSHAPVFRNLASPSWEKSFEIGLRTTGAGKKEGRQSTDDTQLKL